MRIFWHKYNYFASFGAGNCSCKGMKNSPKQFGSIKVKGGGGSNGFGEPVRPEMFKCQMHPTDSCFVSYM